MKGIKLFIPMFLFLLVAAFSTNAQEVIEREAKTDKVDRKRGAKKGLRQAKFDAMVEKLNLSAAQKERFEGINKNYAEKMRAARSNSDGDWAVARKEMKKLRKEQAAEVKTIMTAEQYTKYVEMSKNSRQRGAKPGRGAKGQKDGRESLQADPGGIN